jgi:hypothetical protein
VAPEGSADSLLRSVRSAAAGSYDVLGALERVGGAPLYFARETATGHLVGLALQQDPAEREGFALVLAWEGPRSGADAGYVPAAAYEPGPAEPEPWFAAQDPEEITDPMGRAPAPPPAYTVPATPAPPPPRRRVGLLTGAAVGAAVLGGLTFFALQGTGADTRPQPERSVATVPPPAPVDSTPVAVVPADTAPVAPVAPARPREREKREESNRTATLHIEGALPGGWTRTVNGGSASSSPTVQLRPRRASTVVVDAPGYCTESRTFQLSPGEEYRWVVSMRERPLVGEC